MIAGVTGGLWANDFSDALNVELRAGIDSAEGFGESNVNEPDGIEFSEIEEVVGEYREILGDIAQFEDFVGVADFGGVSTVTEGGDIHNLAVVGVNIGGMIVDGGEACPCAGGLVLGDCMGGKVGGYAVLGRK